MNRLALAAFIVGASACGQAAAPTAVAPKTGLVAGTIRLSGVIPREGYPTPQPHLDNCKVHPIEEVMGESLVLGPGQTLGNVFICVTKGLEDRRFPPPEHPARLTQWCVCFRPRVLGVMVNQFLLIRNGEERLHNVNARPRFGAGINQGHPRAGSEISTRFDRPEFGIPVKCNIHPWEMAWVHVIEHPFFAVTGADGRYSIRELPPGDYEITAWHERFQKAPLVSKVNVVAGETAVLDFTFEVPRK